jgi:Heat induced stress protein YflT
VSQDRPDVQLFPNDQQALDAIRALTRAGVSPDDISVLARSSDEAHRLHDETGAAEDLEAGVNRDTRQDILDVLGSLESLLVPGFGGVLVTGDLIQHIRGVVDDIRDRSGVSGALVRLGIPEEEANTLEGAVASGQILVVIRLPEEVVRQP